MRLGRCIRGTLVLSFVSPRWSWDNGLWTIMWTLCRDRPTGENKAMPFTLNSRSTHLIWGTWNNLAKGRWSLKLKKEREAFQIYSFFFTGIIFWMNEINSITATINQTRTAICSEWQPFCVIRRPRALEKRFSSFLLSRSHTQAHLNTPACLNQLWFPHFQVHLHDCMRFEITPQMPFPSAWVIYSRNIFHRPHQILWRLS